MSAGVRRGRATAIALVAGVALSAAAAPTTQRASAGEGLELVDVLDIPWASEIAFDGPWAYVYGPELWVVHRATRQVLGVLDCPGEDHYTGEIELVRPGLVAINATLDCGVDESTIVFVDVSDPTAPTVVSHVRPEVADHTLTGFPAGPYVYVSPNGCCGDFRLGVEQIIDVSDPSEPVLHTYTSHGLGCHDVGFVVTDEVALAACAAGSETQLWDVSDPLAPVTIARIPTPQVFFNHSAAFSDDGQLLVVGDEAHGATTCTGAPTGALWFYDVSDPTLPVLVGTFGNPHGSPVSSFWATYETWCTAHMFDFEPGTHRLATGWFQGGVNVLDLTDPTFPEEVGWYVADDLRPWAVYWVDGEIWAADTQGACCPTSDGDGVEIFRLAGS